MTNPTPPWGGDPQGSDHPTQRLWPAGPGGPPAGEPAAGRRPPRGRRHGALLWTAGIAAAGLLAAGAVVTGGKLMSHSSPAGQTASTAGQATGTAGQAAPDSPSGQAALLSAVLQGASAPGAIGTGPAGAPGAGVPAGGLRHRPCARAARAARAARRAGLPRMARAARLAAGHCRAIRRRVFAFFLLRGVDGQFTLRTRHGDKTLAFERGVIESVSTSGAVVVKASDGTTWTWDLVPATVVRDRVGKTGRSALTAGEPVWVGGPVVQGVKDARLIVIRPPTAPAARPAG
jgi:hypothetical protein